MIQWVPGDDLAEQAIKGNYVGIPYSKLDCQGFVEEVLKDCGVRKPDGTPYNWRGSNSMWRNHITWKGTIEECKQKFGNIPLGAFMFLVKHDGGEEKKGYHDGLGNASHVGLYVGTSPLPVMDSQPSGGVKYRKLSTFTHVGLMGMIDYFSGTEPKPDSRDKVLEAIHTIRDEYSSDSDCLEALKILTKYLQEVKI